MRNASFTLAALLAFGAGCSSGTGDNGAGDGRARPGGEPSRDSSASDWAVDSFSNDAALEAAADVFGAPESGSTDGKPVATDIWPPMKAEVFAHSATVLYRLDPTTKAVTTVGTFSGNDSAVIDIALDKSGVMFGTTFGGLYKIDKLTAACTLISLGSYPNSLSFVPAGTVDPLQEALVGYEGSTYVRMDLTTGTVSTIGNLGTTTYSSSGDMVSLIAGSSYLTVQGGGCSDCIVEVNPSTGALLKMIGPLSHMDVYGLAYWGGVAYGFDDSGELFQIDVTTGATTTIPMPGAPVGLSFYGAGSTTAAPHF